MAQRHENTSRGSYVLTGFTFLEIMIVLVVIAILALLVLPAGGNDELQRLRAAASLLMADLEYARMNSIGNEADPCVVVFHGTEPQYHLARLGDLDVPIRDPGNGLEFITRFGGVRATSLNGVTIDSLEVGGDNQLTFTSYGLIDQATNARIRLRCGAESIGIIVNADIGEPSIE